MNMGKGERVEKRMVEINIVCKVCKNDGEGGKKRDNKEEYCKKMKKNDCKK